MLSIETLRHLKSVQPHELAKGLGIDFKPTFRGGMMSATWRGEKQSSVSYLKSSQGQWYWTDFGTGEGGSHIDLIMKAFNINYTQAIYQLQKVCDQNVHTRAPTHFSFSLPFSKLSNSSWVIISIRPCNIIDIHVLQTLRHLSRQIIPLEHLKWITLRHNKKGFTRQCYAIKNSSGGYELFSGYPSGHTLSFKSCSGPKDISVINRGVQKWVVSESIIDAISTQQIYGDSILSLISLNGVTQVSRLKAFLTKYHSKVRNLIIALDHDEAGEVARKKVVEICESLNILFEVLNYTGKDPNDALKSTSICKN
jgi:hypothetical protein